MHYFWADNRPYGGGYNEHFIANVPNSDLWAYAEDDIITAGSPSSWAVELYTPSGPIYDGFSTSNTMTPNSFTIGEELAGTDGAFSPTAYYTYNQWLDANIHLHYFNWGQNSDCGNENCLRSDQPPFGTWYTFPQSSSTGGIFEV